MAPRLRMRRRSTGRRNALLFVRDLDAAVYDMPAGEQKVKAVELLRARAAESRSSIRIARNRWCCMPGRYARRPTFRAGSGGLALGRQAVEKLEAALERDPTVYGAATYACLGALYADVDVPVFRSYSRKKARLYLDKALALDPQGPQQNLSLAWLSFKEKDHAAALRLATAASNAPARPGREKADADLRERATSLIAAVNDKAR